MMTNCNRKNWAINVENNVAIVELYIESVVVAFVFEHYGGYNSCNLNPCDLPDVFSELYAIEADLK